MNLKFTKSSLLIFLLGLLIQFVSCKKVMKMAMKAIVIVVEKNVFQIITPSTL